MKTVVTSVMQAVPAVFNVLLISLMFYLIFGILGVIFFKGSFYSCTDPNIEDEDLCVGPFFNA
jgi:voltage-gated sodium channel type II alpha